ncbi:MAG: hypothetical protein GXP30_02845 [Verrucomicrobia bacterium]|nr:hypothetical protein [Verrucomicrobiota bacterium]
MGKGNQISLPEKDVRQLVSLLGKIAILDGDLAAKKRHLMDGLCRLIDADCWAWVLLLPTKPGEKPAPAGFMHGGFSEDRYCDFLEAVEHPDMAHFNERFLGEVYSRQRHTTRLRQQLDPENTFSTSAVYPLWQKADIGPLMLSCYPFPDGCLSFVAMYRKASDALFAEREARIAHILLSEVPWLHAESWPQAKQIKGQMLSPRLRTTLNLLLEGLGRKQIAAHLEIAENTVSGYIKEIYRFYQVQSHAQLMKYFRDGDGGDRLPIG